MSDFIFPELFVQPTSGLTFPWAFKVDGASPGDANFGPTGAMAAEVMLVYSEDLLTLDAFTNPLSQLLGFSWRDDSTFVTDTTPATLRRVLPWRHPYWLQLYCTKIVKFQGLSPDGKYEDIYGPFEQYKIVLLTLQFSRPPYALLPDQDIPENETTGVKEEWRRYTTKVWSPAIEILARQAGTYTYTSGTGVSGKDFPGSVGFPVMKLGLTLTWNQLPQDAVYDEDGFPSNLLFDFFNGTRLPGSVNASVFNGSEVGTLLYLIPKIEPHPLQLPAVLMNLDLNEGAAQLQYNVILNFLYFDPPQGPGAAMSSQGHNNAIFADGSYYPIASKQGGNPPFSSSQFSSIFAIL